MRFEVLSEVIIDWRNIGLLNKLAASVFRVSCEEAEICAPLGCYDVSVKSVGSNLKGQEIQEGINSMPRNVGMELSLCSV